MAKKTDFTTDEAVEAEIARLKSSPYVMLAKKEEAIRYKRRQYMYKLRAYEKKGKQLEADGVTLESLEMLRFEMEEEVENDHDRSADHSD